MATATVSDEPRETDCVICSDVYRNPKILPCGHLLCRDCLLSWITSQQDAKCPLCRSIIVHAQSRSSRSLEQFVDNLPTDLAMKNIADAERILSKEHVCCVCEDVAATTICLSCRDMFCQACTKGHQKSSATKHHSVETLASLTADKLAAAKPSFCNAHADEASKVFCTFHNVAICLICATTDHKQCTVMKEETRMEEARAVLRELITTLSRGEMQIDECLRQLDDQVKKSKAITQAALKDGLKTYDQLDLMIKNGRQHLTELAETVCSDNEEAVQEVRTCLLSRKGKLTTHKQAATRADNQPLTRADLTEMASDLKACVADLDCSALLPPSAKTVALTTLGIDQEVVSRVETALQQELGRLGRIVPELSYQRAPFSFHSNHGTDVLLRGDGHVAEKQGNDLFNGIVISSQPMEVNHLYEVEVKNLSEGVRKDRMLLLPGVVTVSPDRLTLPRHAVGWSSAIVIGGRWINISGKKVKSSFGQQLMGLTEGSRVGVSLDDSRNLLVHRDGVSLGVVTSKVPQPAYALFDLRWMVRALPTTRLK